MTKLKEQVLKWMLFIAYIVVIGIFFKFVWYVFKFGWNLISFYD